MLVLSWRQNRRQSVILQFSEVGIVTFDPDVSPNDCRQVALACCQTLTSILFLRFTRSRYPPLRGREGSQRRDMDRRQTYPLRS